MVKPLGDMSVVQCLGQVGLTHGMTHLGEIELARTPDRRLILRALFLCRSRFFLCHATIHHVFFTSSPAHQSALSGPC